LSCRGRKLRNTETCIDVDVEDISSELMILLKTFPARMLKVTSVFFLLIITCKRKDIRHGKEQKSHGVAGCEDFQPLK